MIGFRSSVVVVRPLTIVLNDISLTTVWILAKLGRNDPSLIILQMVQVHGISRSHRLKIDFIR